MPTKPKPDIDASLIDAQAVEGVDATPEAGDHPGLVGADGDATPPPPPWAALLRAPFPASAIGKLPRAGTTLDYVGHAAVTDRLLAVDPHWSWEPVAWTPEGSPLIEARGTEHTMWIRLTVCGVTRLGVGIVTEKAFEREKQLISDALRNAAMRFGVALDLWSKSDLHGESTEPDPAPPEGFRSWDEASPYIAETRRLAAEHPALVAWVKDQGFPWPWPRAVCDAIRGKVAEVAGGLGGDPPAAEACPTCGNPTDDHEAGCPEGPM